MGLLFTSCNSESDSSGGGLFQSPSAPSEAVSGPVTNSPAPSTSPETPSEEPPVEEESPVVEDGPEITNFLNPMNGTYAQDGKLIFQVEFAQSVLVSGIPRLKIDIGGVERYADYTEGSSTQALVFVYNVQLEDDDSNGIALNSNLIDLNSGHIISSHDGKNAKRDFSFHLESLDEVLVNNSSGVTAPDQVLNVVTAPTTENDTLSVSWSVPNDNGNPILNYSLQYRQQGEVSWTNMDPAPVSNSASVSNLSAGAIYEFRVAANNSLMGEFSSIQTAEIFDVMSLDPIAWLDATNVNGDGSSPSDGSSISEWVDLTGAASNAQESELSKQPVIEYDAQNGLPAIRFDNKDRGLQGTFTRDNGENLTFVIVGQFDTGYSDKCLFEFKGPGQQRGFFIDRRYASNNHFSPGLSKGAFQIWRIEDDGNNAIVTENKLTTLYDGATLFGTDFTGTGSYVLGDDITGNNRMNGHIAEFLVFDRELTPSEISTLETYLQNKWGTP